MIYDVLNLEKTLYQRIEENPDNAEDIIKEFVEDQQKTEESIERMIKLIKHLEFFIDNCKKEEQRIKERRQSTENKIESIKRYLMPFVKEKGKFDVGTFTLSTRISKSVVLSDAEFDLEENKDYVIEKVELKPDKKKIKEALEKGEYIHGASLVEKDNLQIK